MPVFLIPWLLRLGGALLVGLFLWGCWHKLNTWCNGACVDARHDVVSLKADVAERDASIARTQERATALALLWSGQVDRTENAAHIAETSRNEEFRKLADRARAIGADGVPHFGGLSRKLFNDAADLASGSQAPGPAAQPPEATAADTTPTEFVVSLYDWIGTCKARVDEWEQFYKGLQASVPN